MSRESWTLLPGKGTGRRGLLLMTQGAEGRVGGWCCGEEERALWGSLSAMWFDSVCFGVEVGVGGLESGDRVLGEESVLL